MIKVAFADDHQVFLDGLQSLAQQTGIIETVVTANDGIELLALLEKDRDNVDVAVIDINMPNMNGVTVTREIKKRFPKIKVLILSMHEDCKHVESVIKAGARGYIRKGANTREVMNGIEAVHNGALHFGEGVQYPCPPREHGSLTKTEENILRHITHGMAAPDIADTLFISVNTVNTHKRNMMAKLGFNNVQQIVRYGMENGYDRLEEI